MPIETTHSLHSSWWLLAARGLIAIILGLIAFRWPGVTIAALVVLFGAYAMVDGIMAVAAAAHAGEEGRRWGWLALEGILGITAAAVTLFWPGITALSLVYLIAAWAVLTGVLAIATAIRLRKVIRGEWLLALSGAASIVFGVFMATIPLAGAVAIAFWIGTYALFWGVLMIGLGLRLRSLPRSELYAGHFATPLHRPLMR